ncbi:MAG: hypothetical protein COZ46_05380 [Verrucomicrobia bacterium CG_4_10_14_3_um_filter_43_23]|nr:MAG: hypothetical protein AUJ82_08270 [Verrucomicrobia bacterium CG1_02_43_26]PIP59934.1 MAG: hypothetical protein COX01_00890 [Verrucomicrobia bacterium CG22_combo_CG10-13_8_21_14_all_43_17]PIX58156.1 MAG: hypothetical protein COZ46_05380 [Verrucomicrobia bacterium CG_4_10_14_3_um_filter_43_23]PIY61845.1 MAG: hypothetical protein COY94_03325 [Verrucomicrobia bacterium CG_4_10_14_0_8_um_filter_43_34]PJA44466.1 MAG: hypothetical protein CO175_02790 [Verrucomicrobia bacterium CG_4_9_14_3_um_fi
MRCKSPSAFILSAVMFIGFCSTSLANEDQAAFYNQDPTRLEIACLNLDKKITTFSQQISTGKIDKIKLKHQAAILTVAYEHLGKELNHFPQAVRLWKDDFTDLGKVLRSVNAPTNEVASDSNSLENSSAQLALQKLADLRQKMGLEEA